MLHAPKKTLLALAAILAVGMAVPAFADGPVLVTVSGAVSNANRGPIDAEVDKLFAFNDVTFEKARWSSISTRSRLFRRST